MVAATVATAAAAAAVAAAGAPDDHTVLRPDGTRAKYLSAAEADAELADALQLGRDVAPMFGDANGTFCPSSADIAAAIGKELRRGDKAFDELPLHLKDISDIDLDKMDKLSTVTAGADGNWRYVKTFLVDDEVYAAVIHMLPLRESDHVAGDIEKLLASRRIAEVTDPDTVIGGIISFTRAEHLDNPDKAPRRRNLNWNKAVNEALGRWTLTIDTHCPRHRIRECVQKGTVSCQVDLKECFSAYRFSLQNSLANCFRHGGKVYRCTRLSMGQRQASMIASVGTLRICDVPLPPGTHVAVCTDNVNVTGKIEDVRSVMALIVKRAQLVGAAWNEDVSDIDALIATKYDFLGEHYDHDNASMCATRKLSLKLESTTAALMARLDAGTAEHRLLSVHLGVLFFMSSTLRVPIFDHHATMQFMRNRAVAVQKDPALWLKPLPPMPPRVRADLTRWTDHCRRNEPVPIAQPVGEATHVMMSDASDTGFACLIWCIADGKLDLIQRTWGDTFPLEKAKQSTKAEPEAIYRSLCLYFNADTMKGAKVIFYTDHLSYTYAYNAGYGKCWYYDLIIARIAQSFPGLEMELRHVAGTKCIVDSWSRGATCPLDEDDAMRKLLDIVKDLTLAPQTGPFARPLVLPQGE